MQIKALENMGDNSTRPDHTFAHRSVCTWTSCIPKPQHFENKLQYEMSLKERISLPEMDLFEIGERD